MRASTFARKGAPVTAGASVLAVAAVAVSGALASAPPVTVTFGEFFYKPAVITVKVGQKVVFRNVGKIAHTVANTDAKGNILSTTIKPQNLDPGQAQTVSFAKPGVVFYLCTFHPSLMKGRIIVAK